jgi:TPR repeat protein
MMTATRTSQLMIILNNEQISDLRIKAEQGDAEAQVNLGLLYAKGLGVQ